MTNKCEIKITRESNRVEKDGDVPRTLYSEIFGKNNRFISEINGKMRISTPYCENIDNCFDKFIEITNVVFDKLDINNEIILPSGTILIEVLINHENKLITEIQANIEEEYGVNKDTIKELIENIQNNDINANIYVNSSENFEQELQIGLKYSEDACRYRYCLKTCQKIYSESAALIKDALFAGVDYNIVNQKTGIVEFINKEGKREFVIDGNETNRDSYIFPIITNDKYLTKKILEENNLICPSGILVQKSMPEKDKETIIEKINNKPIVIKPRNTNCGVGITILKNGANKEKIEKALEYAFGFDDDVIIEEYISGEECRFLVIGNKCVSVAFRRSASVVGDGKSTIKELIEKKNKEPWHYLTETPVIVDDVVKNFLKNQRYTCESVIEKDKRVYLRSNSNCSTGGESVIVTNRIPKFFKKKAEEAAKCLNAKIAGVDIIIQDVNDRRYSIVEINDTPGYTINEWPYEGKGEPIGLKILELLDLIKGTRKEQCENENSRISSKV